MSGREELLARLREKTALLAPVKELAARVGKKAKNVAVKGTFGLGAVAAGTGAVKSVSQEKQREHAPPSIVPPGY